MNEISLSDSDDEYLKLDIWGTFDNAESDMNDSADVEEILWSQSYETFIRHGNVNRKFVPLKLQDIKNVRHEFDNIHLLLLNNTLSALERNILQDEAKSLEEVLINICPHSMFEAEYLGKNSTYDCTLCKLSYVRIHNL